LSRPRFKLLSTIHERGGGAGIDWARSAACHSVRPVDRLRMDGADVS
jgi:hypothetical protein